MIKKEGLSGNVTITDAEGEYRYVRTECPECAALRARMEDTEGIKKAIMAKYLDEGFKRVDFRENECFLAAVAARDYAIGGK